MTATIKLKGLFLVLERQLTVIDFKKETFMWLFL